MSYLDPLFIFFLLYAILAWRSLPWALAVLAFFLPAYVIRFPLGPLPSTALEIMILLSVIMWGIKAWQSGDWKARLASLSKTPLFWPGVALVFASLIACAFAPDLRAALGIWRAYFLEPVLLYGVVVDVIRSRRDQSRLLFGLGLSVLALTLLAAVQYATGWWLPTWEWTLPETRRATGPFTSPNALGLYVVPIAMVHLGLLFDRMRTNKERSVSVAVVLAGALSIALAVSRGAMAAFAIASLWILYRQWSKRKTVLLTLACVVVLMLIPFTRQEIVSLASFRDASGQSRLALYQGSIDLLKQHPLVGTGLAGFGEAFERVRPAEYTEKLIYPHNIFLNFWTETGLVGLLAILWVIWVVLRLAYKKDLHLVWRDAFVAALLAMLVHGMIDVPYFKNDLAVLTWMVLALLVCYSDRRPVLRP